MFSINSVELLCLILGIKKYLRVSNFFVRLINNKGLK